MVKKSERLIIEGSDGDPRRVATENPYSGRIEDNQANVGHPRAHQSRMASFAKAAHVRRSASTNINMASSLQSGSSMQSAAQAPLYYDYRWSTPDKYYFPRNRIVANSIWREVYRRDAVVATATDMYSEMPWSEFDLSGLDDPVVRRTYEEMFNDINILPKLPDYTRDYFVTGECVLHALFNDDTGLWSRVESFNPDFVRVQNVGLAAAEPLLWLMPTPELKKIINATDPRVRQLSKALPRELINAVRMNKEVPLENLNTTYLARFRNSTDVRGTSIYTRVYRVIMYEDFIVNASLAIAQRHAAPMRLFKLGDPNTGWLPTDEDIASFMEQLSIAESDPLGAIVTHANATCELVGVADRVLLISKEWDFIERMKLLALGLSKSVLLGDSSFSSAAAGLQVLSERLLNLRSKFEKEWIIKKLCLPIAKIHKFYKRTKAELDHKVRVNKKDFVPLVPQIRWKKSLEPTQEIALLNVWRDLKERGLLSDRTYVEGSGASLDVERRNIEEEIEYRKEFQRKYGTPPQPQAQPGGGFSGGGPATPPPPTEEAPAAGAEIPEGEAPPPEPTPEPITTPGGSKLFKDSSHAVTAQLHNVSDQINDVFDTVVEKLDELSDNISTGQAKHKVSKAKVRDITEHMEEGRGKVSNEFEKTFQSLNTDTSFLIGK